MNTYSFTRNKSVTPANAGVYGSLLAQGLHLLFLICALFAMAACAGPRGVSSFAKSSSASASSGWAAKTNMAPVVQYGAGPGYGSTGGVTILAGDTFQKIAARYDVDLGDLIALNSGVTFAPGARMNVPPPKTYRVRAGDTLFSLARTFDVPIDTLKGKNGLGGSAGLRVGQVLNIPRVFGAVVPTMDQGDAGQMDIAAAAPVERVDIASLKSLASTPATRRVAVSSPRQGIMAPPAQTRLLHRAALTAPKKGAGIAARASEKEIATFPPPRVATGPIPPRAGNRFLRPVGGTVLSKYGAKGGGLYNEGINIAAPRGTAVRAAENGRVVYVGNGAKGYGNLILVKHADGYVTAYAHMDKVLVGVGQDVSRGSAIGTVGSSGNVDRAQLHFEIRKGRNSIDPVAVL